MFVLVISPSQQAEHLFSFPTSITLFLSHKILIQPRSEVVTSCHDLVIAFVN